MYHFLLKIHLRNVGAVVAASNLIGFGITAVFETHKITDLVGVGAFVAATTSLQVMTFYTIIIIIC